jgi:enterochelin esterase family protein
MAKPPAEAAPEPWREIVPSERIGAAAAEIAQSADPAAAVERFWESVAATPLWERDGQLPGAWRATFLWRGVPEITSHVTLCGPIVFSEACGILFEQISGTDIWHLTLRVPPQTRSAYAISPNGLLGRPGEIGQYEQILATWVRDPRNPSSLVIPVNEQMPAFTPCLFSLAEAPDTPAQTWRVQRPGTPTGELEQHNWSSAILGNTRRVWTYTPAGWDPGQRDTPLLLAFDGWDAVNVTRLPVVLDNLIAAGAIPPTVAVLIDCGTLEMRVRELDADEPFTSCLAQELLPWAGEHWRLALDRSRTVVAGISLGGKAATFAGLRRPDLFGKVIAQSAAVTLSEPGVVEELAQRAPSTPSERLEIYLDVGLLEIDSSGDRAFLGGVRNLCGLLRSAGHGVHCVELACGHDDIVDGETIADGLQLLLPAKLAAPAA